jgi:hypothetical protein
MLALDERDRYLREAARLYCIGMSGRQAGAWLQTKSEPMRNVPPRMETIRDLDGFSINTRIGAIRVAARRRQSWRDTWRALGDATRPKRCVPLDIAAPSRSFAG